MSDTLVSLAPFLFGIFFVITIVLVGVTLFTKKGRHLGPELLFGCKVLEDLGEIGNTPLPFGHQRIHLLKCKKGNELFAVIEVTEMTAGSINMHWVKLDSDILRSMIRLVKP